MKSDLVTLVIPGRDCAGTIGKCLDSVVPYLDSGLLKDIIFVDDGSKDATAAIVEEYPVRVLKGSGSGPGAARNMGWRACDTPLVWFIDSDCVAEEEALPILLAHMEDSTVAGAGGSYGNMRPDSLLASLIHEEIISRHAVMPDRVNFLATFNVVYRTSVLKEVGGFDERFLKAQDAELSFRIRQADHHLGFDDRSRVRHFHPVSLRSYLDTQKKQGYWRAWLYFEYPEKMKGDSYSGFFDHVQPPLAVASMLLSPSLLMGPLALLELPVLSALAAAQLPRTVQLVRRTGDPKFAGFAPMSMIRAYARGVGLLRGSVDGLASRLRGGGR